MGGGAFGDMALNTLNTAMESSQTLHHTQTFKCDYPACGDKSYRIPRVFLFLFRTTREQFA